MCFIVDAMGSVYCNLTWPTVHTKSRPTTGYNHFTHQLRCFSLFLRVPTNTSASVHNFDIQSYHWAGSTRFQSRTGQTHAIPILCPWFSSVSPECFEHNMTHPFSLCAFTKQLQDVTSKLVISVRLSTFNSATFIGRTIVAVHSRDFQWNVLAYSDIGSWNRMIDALHKYLCTFMWWVCTVKTWFSVACELRSKKYLAI